MYDGKLTRFPMMVTQFFCPLNSILPSLQVSNFGMGYAKTLVKMGWGFHYKGLWNHFKNMKLCAHSSPKFVLVRVNRPASEGNIFFCLNDICVSCFVTWSCNARVWVFCLSSFRSLGVLNNLNMHWSNIAN